MKIGAQLYTVRDYCQNLESFSESLKKVADIGYETVQVSGSCAFEGTWLKDELVKNGLRCVLTHTPVPELKDDIAKVAEKHTVFGCDNVGLGYYGFLSEDMSDYENFKAEWLPVAKSLKAAGKQFMYHNHNSEFNRLPNGKLVLEAIAEDFTPDELNFTLDTFWVTAGGGDPAKWLTKLSGRVKCIHLKDYSWRPGNTDFSRYFDAVGSGNLNWDRIFEAAEKAGTEYMLVEQDNCYGEDPFTCLKRSYDFLKSRGFD